ncbi:uncharacterized protein LOC143246105 [Tachypleus tridentatus]|uniref:uncharacterized protein LOC143246105 n=1 Tax=Tachypleus tridentatus TaxID=6853 RepID=UPI003FD5D1CA
MTIPEETYVILTVISLLGLLVCVICCVVVSCYCKRMRENEQKAALKEELAFQRSLRSFLSQRDSEQKSLSEFETISVRCSPKPKETRVAGWYERRHNEDDIPGSTPEIYNKRVFTGGFNIRGGHFREEDCISSDSGYAATSNIDKGAMRGRKAPKGVGLVGNVIYHHACQKGKSPEKLCTVEEKLAEEEEEMVENNVINRGSDESSVDSPRVALREIQTNKQTNPLSLTLLN